MVRHLIRQHCGVTLKLGGSCARWGSRPSGRRRAIEQVPAKVGRSTILRFRRKPVRQARRFSLRTSGRAVEQPSLPRGRRWAKHRWCRRLANGSGSIWCVSPQGSSTTRMTAVRFIAFLKRLLHNQTQPIFLIVDQHSSHRAKVVQEFVASTDGHLELFFLPPYFPRNSIRMNSCGTI